MPKKRKDPFVSARELLKRQGIGFDGDKFVNGFFDRSQHFKEKRTKKKRDDYF